MTKALENIAKAYLMMAVKANYRPAAPSDGFGNVTLSDSEIEDHARLHREAVDYAANFRKEEDERSFMIGVTDYRTARAFVFALEACRAICGTKNDLASDLLRMAIDELKKNRGHRMRPKAGEATKAEKITLLAGLVVLSDEAIARILTIAAELWPEGEIEIRVKNPETNEITHWVWDRKGKKPVRRGTND